MVWRRLVLSTGNIMLSFVLGIIAMFLVAFYAENMFQSILTFATRIEYAMTNSGLIPLKYNNLVTLMLGKSQIVLMMFVLGVRILTALVVGIFTTYVLGWRD